MVEYFGRFVNFGGWEFWEEGVLLIFVIAAVPAFFYALERLTGRRFQHKLLVLLIFLMIFMGYLEINEQRARNQAEELWLPKDLVDSLANQIPSSRE